MSLIEFQKVTKIYRKGFRAIKVPSVVDLSFTVEEGRIVGFVGPNGAGKTTSIKMMMGLVRPTSGTILIQGKKAPAPESRTGISFLSEQPYFYDHLTVLESLHFAYRLNRLAPHRMQEEIRRVLEKVKLTDAQKKKVREMSKGMQQRLNMAQALLGDARIYILDEPMSGLDPIGRTLFRSIFRELVSQGKSIFFSTHILDDIEQVCDSVVVLSKGKLTYQGAIADILDKGFIGTDIRVDTVSDAVRTHLLAAGFDVTDPFPGTSLIFIPAGKDPRTCQELLYERKIFPKSIESRRTSLEALLYG